MIVASRTGLSFCGPRGRGAPRAFQLTQILKDNHHTNDRQHYLRVADLFVPNREDVLREDGEVRFFAYLERAQNFVGEPREG